VAGGASAGEELGTLFRLVASRHTADAAVKEAAAALGSAPPGLDTPSFEPGTEERRAWDAVVELLGAAIDEGSVRPDLTPADLFALLSGLPTEPGLRDRYVEIVLDGVRANTRSGTVRSRPSSTPTSTRTTPRSSNSSTRRSGGGRSR
jgi:hypothetical protein